MSEIYFTIAGTNHWHGDEFIEPKMEVKFVTLTVLQQETYAFVLGIYESGGIQVGTQCLKQRDQYPYGSATDSVIK